MKLTETKLRNIIREELKKLTEAPARTGTGGRRTAEGQGEVYKVPNPNSRHGEREPLVVDVVRKDDRISIERVLGFSSGRPPRGEVRDDWIEKQIRRGNAEKLDVPFMAKA